MEHGEEFTITRHSAPVARIVSAREGEQATPCTDAVLERLRHDPAHTPAVWLLELANVARVTVRRHFAVLPNVTLEYATEFLQAAAWHVDGLDFADALHLARAARCTRLETFDRRVAKVAARLGLSPPVGMPQA